MTAAATLGLAAAAWVVALQRMDGMDMGVATALGSPALFMAAWVPMMAAMMLPGAVPAVARRGSLVFAGSYLVVWSAVGLVVYAAYRPHGAVAAGALTLAAGVYELTPFKRACRLRCRSEERSGVRFGLACVGSSAGLMVVLVALGVMSVTWMCVVGGVVLAQKIVPPRRWIDVPLALAIVAFGVVVIAATPTM